MQKGAGFPERQEVNPTLRSNSYVRLSLNLGMMESIYRVAKLATRLLIDFIG